MQQTPHVHKNLINQAFNITEKNNVWYGDITYIPTNEGMLYISAFIDAYTRKCVGYCIDSHMRDSLVIQSLENALVREKPDAGLIVHSDQGSQYTGHRFYEFTKAIGIQLSHSRKGNPYDNAVMESFLKSFKREVLDEKQFKTKQAAVTECLVYLETYYNHERIHSSIGYKTPEEASQSTKSS
ncbi:hypothetical protein CBF27_13955 [Vagococcus acidifermentans]|uniref:Integrase catalytic domain-containing protein n=2 Tax=Vagococcus acidifermentans TaxID=564710 RepID=A0A430ALT4_9ENTE|nr:hypothetical protein CBF27_13955 [Vagococcus acidifermentans]